VETYLLKKHIQLIIRFQIAFRLTNISNVYRINFLKNIIKHIYKVGIYEFYFIVYTLTITRNDYCLSINYI